VIWELYFRLIKITGWICWKA